MSISHFERDGCPSIVTLTSEKHKQKVESCFLSPKILTKSILVYMFFLKWNDRNSKFKINRFMTKNQITTLHTVHHNYFMVISD